jgi:hypothetical protein
MVKEAVMRCVLLPLAVMTLVAYTQPGVAEGLGEPIEIDSESGAEIHVLGGDERPADNIYGEQPYGDATGRCKRACLTRTEYDGKQWSHAHPYLTSNNRWLIFGARRNAHPQAYGAKLKEGWLEIL